MRPEDSRHPFAVRRSLALATLIAVLSVLAPVVARAEQDTCESDTEKPRDTVAPTRPGPWREDLKRGPSRIRVPGTRTVAPQDPLSIDATTKGRWVPGYRPATGEAQAEFDAWKAAQRATLGTSDIGRLAHGPSSSYAANLLSGGRTDPGPDEPITHIVRDDKYSISPVDLRTLPASAESASALPKAGKPERDTGYHHLSGMTWDEYLWSKKQAENAPPTPDGQQANAVLPSSLAPPFAGVGFDAIGTDFTGAPPDPIMAVGPGHLVAIVNSRYRVWDKSGNPLTPAISLDQFFSGVANCSGAFDVFVDYDEALDRFVMGGETLFGAGGATDSYLCVAATATGDPTGVWNRISFRADVLEQSTWIDYPHMGIGLDAIYITGNMFSDGGGFHHIGAYAVDKTALYQGTAVSVAEANLGGQFFTAQPVKLHGFDSGGWPPAGTPHHLLAGNGGGSTRIWRWSAPFQTGPTIYGTLFEASFNGNPPSADELGATSNGRNDTGSSKWLDAEYRHGKLWATRNVACNFGGGNAETCVDWIQVDVSGATPLLEQQQTGGAYGSTGDFRYYPDLSVDRNDNLAIGYTKSSATSYTQIWVTGREAGDPPGTLQTETLRRAGLGNYSDGIGCQGTCDRWGDYTGLTVDPDGCTFWYLGQYSDGGNFNWATHIGSFRYDSCSTDSLLQINKSTYTCDDSMTITVTDSVPINAATVSAETTVSTSTGDAETIAAGSWTGPIAPAASVARGRRRSRSGPVPLLRETARSTWPVARRSRSSTPILTPATARAPAAPGSRARPTSRTAGI